MATNNFSQFHELAEQFKGEIPLKKICEQAGIPYRSYISWRSQNGIAPRMRRKAAPEGMVEVENGLKFDRSEMEVDSLVEFGPFTSIMAYG